MTRQVYEDGMHVLEWYEGDDSHSFSICDLDGTLIKEYRTSNDDAAQTIWDTLCNMMDFEPEEIIEFRLKEHCGRNIAKVTEVLVE